MKLNKEAFKKPYWNSYNYGKSVVNLIYDCEYPEKLLYSIEVWFGDDGTVPGVVVTAEDSVVQVIEINLDEIATVEEIASTAEAIYQAIKDLEVWVWKSTVGMM